MQGQQHPFHPAHLIHARWHSSVSVLAAMTWQFSFSNSLKRSLNAMISVGQTNVKSWEATYQQQGRAAGNTNLLDQ